MWEIMSQGINKRVEKSDENKGKCVRMYLLPAVEAYIFSSQCFGASVKRSEATSSIKKKIPSSVLHIQMQKRNICCVSHAKPVHPGGCEELARSGPCPREGPPQKLLNSSYFFIQSICGAFFFSLAWIFIFSSAAVALRPISANGSIIRLPSSSAS